MTKGEMLKKCLDQDLIEELAHVTTSCGRYGVYKNTHCGRCVPCLVRRASFYHWKGNGFDKTKYKFSDLAINDDDHAHFDDVFSMRMAVVNRAEIGTSRWIGASLSSNLIDNKKQYENTVERGLLEMQEFLRDLGLV